MATLTKRTNGESLRARSNYPRGSDYGSSFFDPLTEQLQSMRRMAREMLGGQFDSSGGGMFPRIELYEKDGNYVIEAQVPGFKRDEIEIECSENRVTISGSSQRQAVEDQLKGRVHWSEFEQKDFSRSIALPVEVDPDKVNARLQDGVLTVTLPAIGASLQKRVPITA